MTDAPDPTLPTDPAEPIEPEPPGGTDRRWLLIGLGALAAIVLVALVVALVRSDDGSDDDVATVDRTTRTTEATSTSEAEVTSTTAIATTTTAEVTTTTAAPTTAPSTAPPTTTPVLPGGSTDPRSGGSSGPLPALLTDLRVGCQGSVSRVVLEFADGAMPEWAVQYVDPPIIADPSGETVAVRGDAFLAIRLTPAWGHDLEQPGAPATYPGPTRISGGCGSALEVVQTGEFEAVYSWVIGVPSRAPFTVSTLGGPSRLVIDVAA